MTYRLRLRKKSPLSCRLDLVGSRAPGPSAAVVRNTVNKHLIVHGSRRPSLALRPCLQPSRRVERPQHYTGSVWLSRIHQPVKKAGQAGRSASLMSPYWATCSSSFNLAYLLSPAAKTGALRDNVVHLFVCSSVLCSFIFKKSTKRATKLLISLKHVEYSERLRKLQLSTLKYRRLRRDMIEIYNFYKMTHNYYD